MKVGLYTFAINPVPLDCHGMKAVFTRLGSWPKGDCLRYSIDNASFNVLDSQDWLDQNGKLVLFVEASWTWPGEVVKDVNGKTLCVPLVDGKLVVADSPDVRATATPVADNVIKSAPNGVYAFIRKPVIPALASLYVEVLQDTDVDIQFATF